MNNFFKSTLCAVAMLCASQSYAAPVFEHEAQLSEKDLEAVFERNFRGRVLSTRRPGFRKR